MKTPKFKTLLYEKDEAEPRIVFVTLNRPEKYNAISIGPNDVTGELQKAVKAAEQDDQIKVIIFKAAGKNFSAGFDLSMVYRVYGGKPTVHPYQATRLKVDEDQLMGFPHTIFNCKKVTIAQVHGWCIEAGIYLVEHCDIAIAATNSKFAHRGQRLAFGGMPWPIEFLSHAKKQTELIITGRTISGKEAEEAGIITKAVPLKDLESEVYNLAKAVCLLPADALAMGKMARKHTYFEMGVNNPWNMMTYHTLGTNLVYKDDEKESIFIRDREKLGEKEAFHKLHGMMEDALNKTKHFRSYTGEE